jgi:hypothetical protein
VCSMPLCAWGCRMREIIATEVRHVGDHWAIAGYTDDGRVVVHGQRWGTWRAAFAACLRLSMTSVEQFVQPLDIPHDTCYTLSVVEKRER